MTPAFNLVGTNTSPKISFDLVAGVNRIEGRSRMEDSILFYEPVIEWLNAFEGQIKESRFNTDTHHNRQQFIFNIDYFNSSSGKVLLQILQKLDGIISFIQDSDAIADNVDISMSWQYSKGDELIKDRGEEFQDVLENDLHLEMVEE